MLLGRYSQFPSAGYAAWRALGCLLELDPEASAARVKAQFWERLDAFWEQRGLPPKTKEEIVALYRELAPFLQPEPRYVPGFIQKRITRLVALIHDLYRGLGGRDLEPRLLSLSPQDWREMEKNIGPVIGQVRTAMGEMTTRPEDFRDLFELRKKVQVWAPALLPSLQARGHAFKIDSISRVNISTGYIWVAFLPDPGRKKMDQATYSLSFTPRHCRAGMEMGGKTRPARQAYYRQFLAGELDGIFSEMAPLGGSLVDIAWYFCIRDSIALDDYLSDKDGTRDRVRKKLRQGLERLPRENLYSWNILLPAVIIPPETFCRESTPALLVELAEPVSKLIRRIET